MAPDHVVYLGTASKTPGPGLRLAWMVLTPQFVGPVVEAKRHTELQTEALGELALADLLTSHAYDRHVRASRLRYRRRRDLLLSRLAALQPRADFTVHGIAAGLHVLLGLPAPVLERTVLDLAAREDVDLLGLSAHWHRPGPRHPPGIIVGYGCPSEGAYPAAPDALIRVLQSVAGA
jgi:GntR family transcriptional regulator/MocR family aminotransferase